MKKLANKPAKLTTTSLEEKKTTKTQYKLIFIPIMKKKDTPVEAEATEIVWYDSEVNSTTATSTATTETDVTPTAIVLPLKLLNVFGIRIPLFTTTI